MELWLDDSRFALYCLSVLKLHGVMYSWLPLKKRKAFCFYGPLLYSWSGHVNLINRIYYDKYVHLNHEFYWKNVVLCFLGHNFFRSLSARCSLTLLVTKRREYIFQRKLIIWRTGNMCILYELVSGVVFIKVW